MRWHARLSALPLPGGSRLTRKSESSAFTRFSRVPGQADRPCCRTSLVAERPEVEVINGAVVRSAEELGVDVPLNRAMVALINGLERAWID